MPLHTIKIERQVKPIPTGASPAVSNSELARISHQLSAAAGNLQQSAAFARLGVLDVPQVRAPRPSGRKHHISQHLSGLATKDW